MKGGATCLPLLLQLLLRSPAGDTGVAVGARVLPQLVHEEAVEEVALWAQPHIAPLRIPHLNKQCFECGPWHKQIQTVIFCLVVH